MMEEEIWDGSVRFAFPSSLVALCRKDTCTAGRVVPARAPIRWEGAAGIGAAGVDEGSLQLPGVQVAPPATLKGHAAPLPAWRSRGPVSLLSSRCDI